MSFIVIHVCVLTFVNTKRPMARVPVSLVSAMMFKSGLVSPVTS